MAIKYGVSSLLETITGTSAVDTIFGGAGDDVAYGGGGDDSVFGGANNDVAKGRAQSQYDNYHDRKGLSNFDSTHAMTMFYLIGCGTRIKEVLKETGIEGDYRAEVRALHNRMFLPATLAILATIAAFVLGGGADTKVLHPLVHGPRNPRMGGAYALE